MAFFNSGSIRPNHSDAMFDNAMVLLRRDRVTRLKLVGSTDRTGSADYNLRLSRRRAEAVKAGLVKRGFPADAIEVQGTGENRLLYETPDGVAQIDNRYVVFEIVAFDGTAANE